MIRKLTLLAAALSLAASLPVGALGAETTHHARRHASHDAKAHDKADHVKKAGHDKAGHAKGGHDKAEGGRHRHGHAATASDEGDDAGASVDCKPGKGRGRHAKPGASCKASLRGAHGKSDQGQAKEDRADDQADCVRSPSKAPRRGKHGKPTRARSASHCVRGSDAGADLGGGSASAEDRDCAPAKPVKGRRGRKARASADAACHASAKSAREAGLREAAESAADEDCAPAPKHGRAAAHGRRGRHGKAQVTRARACATHASRDRALAEADCAPVHAAREGRARHARAERRHGAKGRHAHETPSRSHARAHCERLAAERPLTRAPSPPVPMVPRYLPPPIPREMFAQGQPSGAGGGQALTSPGAGVLPPPPAAVAGSASAPQTPASQAAAGQQPPANHRPSLFDLWSRRRTDERRSRPAAARMSASAMVGRSDAELRSSLGEPDVRRAEGDGALWTYRMPNCSLLVFMRREGSGTAYRVTGAQAGPPARGGPAPDVDACLQDSSGRP